MPAFQTSQPQPGNGGVILKPGDYPFVVVDAREKTSKTSGNAMIQLKLRVAEATILDYLVFTDSAAWKVDQFLRSIGCHPGEGRTVDVITEDLVGQRGMLKVRTGHDDRGDRSEVDSYTWKEEGDVLP